MSADFNVTFGKCIVLNGTVFLNGVELPPVPSNSKNINVIQLDDKVYIDGYEWKNNGWKRTLKALWYKYF